jgi:hypothetical protein
VIITYQLSEQHYTPITQLNFTSGNPFYWPCCCNVAVVLPKDGALSDPVLMKLCFLRDMGVSILVIMKWDHVVSHFVTSNKFYFTHVSYETHASKELLRGSKICWHGVQLLLLLLLLLLAVVIAAAAVVIVAIVVNHHHRRDHPCTSFWLWFFHLQ